MNDKFFRLLQMLRTPREFPPVGPVPVEDSGGSIVRDQYGRPVKALGRVREPYAQPPAAGMQLMPGAGAAYQGQMGGMPQVAPFVPPPGIQGDELAEVRRFQPQQLPAGQPLPFEVGGVGVGQAAANGGAAVGTPAMQYGAGQDVEWSPEETADIERNLAEMAWQRNNSYLDGLLSLVAGEAEAAQDFSGKKQKRKVRK